MLLKVLLSGLNEKSIGAYIQGISIRPFPDCEIAASKLRQKR